MSKPKIAFIGNCQVHTYATLAKFMLPDAELRTVDFSGPASRDTNFHVEFLSETKNFDFFIVQPNDVGDLCDDRLKERWPKKTFKMTNFLFRGLYPDSCHIGQFGNRLIQEPTTLSSLIVLDAFKRGLTEAQAVASFNPDNYERLGLFQAWESSITEMRRREEESSIDLAGAEYMEEACRLYRAFLRINHPSLLFLSEYFAMMLDRLDIKYQNIRFGKSWDPAWNYDEDPVADEVAEYFKLRYRTTQLWKINALDKKFIDRTEFVNRFYQAYKKIPMSSLVVHSPMDMVASLREKPEFSHLVTPA